MIYAIGTCRALMNDSLIFVIQYQASLYESLIYLLLDRLFRALLFRIISCQQNQE